MAYLGLIGGMTVKETTPHVLKMVMTKTLAMTFNGMGNRGKHAFSETFAKEVVRSK